MDDLADSTAAQPNYTVIARRYRPRSFTELVGQDHVAQALSKAIESGRVGHAYLFTGARGVGKTSTARIFAKTLSIPDDASDELADEISAAVDSGADMDVIEIDGASNRGIEEIRQLRSSVNVRPSRARFKIYIIDEVHMLTDAAFNALLKTLEEPPEHVKFIFCTTNPDKMPITVLSRCQRFDFVPVKFETIQERLAAIAKSEGFEVEPEALALLARRAAGSMRDSQSLLEQIVSFASGTITAQQVHSMLGTADESALLSIVQSLSSHDPLAAIAAVNQAASSGADSGQLAEQLLNYMRDLMTAGIGGSPQLLNLASPTGHAQLKELADSWGLQSILSAIQILDEAIVRMRASVAASTLLEVALIQISQLEHLASIPALLEAFGSARAGSVPQKKKLTSDSDRQTGTEGQEPNGDLHAQWRQATGAIEGLLADYCHMVEAVESLGSGTWRVMFPAGANQACEYCEQSGRKEVLTAAVASHLGQSIRLQLNVRPGEALSAHQQPATSSVERLRTMREVAENPLVKKVIELLDGEVVRVHPAQASVAAHHQESPARNFSSKVDHV